MVFEIERGVSGSRRLASRVALAAAILTAALTGAPRLATAADVLVFAAASLKNALDDAIISYRQQSGDQISASYAASSALARQIASGAPADIFISADLDWMDYAQRHNLIRPETRKNLLGNRLVLIAPASHAADVEIAPNFPLAELLGDGRLAMADPDSVPAGKYGKMALEALGVWSSVEGRVARAENVRAALFFVSRQEAPFGIVFETDAAADKNVKIVGVFPDGTHPPIIYPVAVTARSKNPDAGKFLNFLESEAAAPIFEKQGFKILR